MAKKKDSKNMLFVSLFIGSMILFMFGTVVYVTGKVANCSSVKKVRKVCMIEKYKEKPTYTVYAV
jgi:hypothetical protein